MIDNKIRILLWDVDGTILNFTAAEKAAIRKGFERMQLGTCTDEMLADYSQINRSYWIRLEKGEMSKSEILVSRFRDFFEKYGLNAELAVSFNGHYQEDLGDTVCFNDDGYELIVDFGKKYLQYAVTNGTAVAQHKKLRLSGLDQIFRKCFISDEIGFEKPSREFFDASFQMIREDIGIFQPEEVLIIGDSMTSDMTGGIQAGIKTCWYNPKNLKNTLKLPVDYEIQNLQELKKLL